MPRQIREILASVAETGDRGRNTGAPGKYRRSGNPSWLGHLTHKIVSEMTYNVSSGTLNTTIPYHTTDDAQLGLLCFPCFPCVAYFRFF